MRFDYVREEMDPLPGETGVQAIYEPIILVRFIGPTQTHLIRGLLDTGSSETLLPLRYMEKLGVPRGEKLPLIAANASPFVAWLGIVDLELRKGRTAHQWSAQVGFTPRRDRALLGHAGFLDHFTATFDGLRRRVTLRPNGTFPAPVIDAE